MQNYKNERLFSLNNLIIATVFLLKKTNDG